MEVTPKHTLITIVVLVFMSFISLISIPALKKITGKGYQKIKVIDSIEQGDSLIILEYTKENPSH